MAAPAKLISTSIGFQDPKGNVVANGMLMLTLSQTATVTATGGQVTTEPIFLNLDANGKITSTAIWFNDELSPSGTIYYGVVYSSNKVRMIPGLDKLQYSITGASFDIATATQSGPASPSFAGAVMLTPTATQTITVGGLTLSAGGFTATSATSTFAGVSVTSVTNTGDTSLSTGKVIKWNSDFGISRTAATAGAVGNGTQGDTSGSLTMAGLTATSITSGANPAASGIGLRGPNNTALITARNSANNGDFGVIKLGADNLTHLVGGGADMAAPVATDTIVGKATTDTLTNKTLGGSGSTSKDTFFNRFRATQGSAVVSGDFAIGSGFGNTASLSAISGSDAAGTVTVTANGTGLAGNPTLTLTFHDGTWTNAPIVIATRGDITALTSGGTGWCVTSVSATSVQFTLNDAAPTAGQVFILYWIAIGK